VVKNICETMSEMDGGDLKYAGVNHLLEYPEFADAHEFKELLGVLEEKRDILKLVSDTEAEGDGPQVIIGSENGVEEMKNSTLVFQKIKAGGKVIGAIGILGPRRMDYSKVISTVEYIAGNISELLNTTPKLPSGDGEGNI
jgi:heat-inducible transcriptional repressor